MSTGREIRCRPSTRPAHPQPSYDNESGPRWPTEASTNDVAAATPTPTNPSTTTAQGSAAAAVPGAPTTGNGPTTPTSAGTPKAPACDCGEAASTTATAPSRTGPKRFRYSNSPATTTPAATRS